MSYTVGDVIWVVGSSRPGLRVFQIVEEVTKKTLQGEITTYMISPPSKKTDTKKMNLSKLDGSIYSSADSAKKAMQAHAEKAIDQMFEHTEKLVKTYFVTSPPVSFEPPEDQIEEEGFQKIMLENGQVARVKIPDGL